MMKNESAYFQPEIETLSVSAIRDLQLKGLREMLQRCMQSEFYRRRFREAGVSPEDIRSLDDLQRLPFTTKEDLRENYPFGLCCVPLQECVRLHSSSGTTGNPTVVLHTRRDLDDWATAVARCLWMVGSRPDDVFQNSAGYGMFTAGLGFQYGAEKVGMLTVPAAAGNTLRQIKFIKDFGTTVLHAIPSYASRIYEVMRQEGVDPVRDTRLRVLCIGAEPHSEEQRRRIEENLHVKAYNSYGISEMMGPGVAFECPEQNGLHIWEDYFIAEIIDLKREAMPLVRYRTRDLTRFLPGDCPCGRHHRRLARLQGRSDDMIILKGVNIFPIQIEKILLSFPELGTDYLITLENKESNDTLTVDVELKELFTDDYSKLQSLEREITRRLRDEILVSPCVRIVPKGSLKVSDEKKAVRVKDLRKLY